MRAVGEEMMTMENIHIDHIKPVNKFDLNNEEELLACCHFTNLQPLLAKQNLQKSGKWSDEHEAYWNANIRDNSNFIEIYYVWWHILLYLPVSSLWE